jgi:hypothetical protein
MMGREGEKGYGAGLHIYIADKSVTSLPLPGK